jgi:tetratricopeptide (TPR) repeat protein
MYRRQEKYEEAERSYVRALRVLEAKAPGSAEMGMVCGDLAGLYQAQRKYEKAEPLYLKAVAVVEKAYGAEHLEVGRYLHLLGEMYYEQKMYEKAEGPVERSVRILEKALGARHPDVLVAMTNYADVLEKVGRGKEAREVRGKVEAVKDTR